MKSIIKKMFRGFVLCCLHPLLDVILSPIITLSAVALHYFRKRRFKGLFLSRAILYKIGVFPINDYYNEPLFNPKRLRKSLREDRDLPGIDFNINEQLDVLDKFDFNEELKRFPVERTKNRLEYFYNNDSFTSGDAEYLYNIIRLFKPKKMIEVGSGNSTLMALNATNKNKLEDSDYHCELVCIEPYKNIWLEKTGAQILRSKVEDIDLAIFKSLNSNDILFIDSSHMIRPQGDVLFEYLEILPTLKSGVLIHIHDIFTPKDYLDKWIYDSVFFWNEQYLLEAFLTFNSQFRIIGAINYLMHNHYKKLSEKCPILKNKENREPGSFWLIKN